MQLSFNPETMTSEELAQAISMSFLEAFQNGALSVRSIQKWAKEGMPHHFAGKDLRFAWPAALAWFLAHKFRGAVATVKASGVPTKADSEARILATKAKREEMRLAKEEGRLVPGEEIEPAWMRVAETVKNRVMTLAPAAKEAIPHLTTEDVKTLQRLCREALEELSRVPGRR
jgi:phage terminase Nu1 subunit (DNA packaging protein)